MLRRLRESLKWYTFILPSIACLVIMTYIPTFTSFRYSFYDINAIGSVGKYIGLKNYTSLLASTAFQHALINTVILIAVNYLVIPIGMILASFINSLGKSRTQAFFRIGYFVPNVISTISIIMVFKYVLLQNGGLLNSMLSALAGHEVAIGWITDPNINKFGVSIMSIWQNLGYTMLICLAGLQSIPRELYEAAEVDSANAVKRWWHITVPNMTSIFAFLFITSTISGFSRFTDLYVLSFNSAAGGSKSSLQSLLMYIYQFSFENPKFGFSSAGVMILFVIVLIVTVINMRLTKVLNDR